MCKRENQTAINSEFVNMICLAETYFNTSDLKNYEYHQCVVLRTNDGKETVYSFACNSVEDLIDQSCSVLSQDRKISVQKIVCMWDGGALDVPCHKFMEKLCDISAENKRAEILLSSHPGAYSVKRICDIVG